MTIKEIPLLMSFNPKDGSQQPYPSEPNQYRFYHSKVAWLYNPFTGMPRKAEDIGTDTFGELLTISKSQEQNDPW